MKPARLRPQAKDDRRKEVRYYLDRAGAEGAHALLMATQEALNRLEHQLEIGSPRLGDLAEIPGLRSGRVTGFPLLWCYLDRDDHLDVVRLLRASKRVGSPQ